MIKRLISPLEGWLYLIAFGLLATALIGPQVNTLIQYKQRADTANMLIASHISDLAQPPPVDEYLKYQSFIHTDTSGTGKALTSSEIQAALIDLLRPHKARLVDLRALDTDRSIETLEALVFKLEFEGDIKSMLDTISALGELPQPVLINALTMKPVGRFDRPDRRIRVSLELSFWTEGAQS